MTEPTLEEQLRWAEERADGFLEQIRAWQDRARSLEEQLEAVRLQTVKTLLALMETAGTLNTDDDAIIPHSNGYSCWFIARENAVMGTAPMSAEEIVARVKAREASSPTEEPL